MIGQFSECDKTKNIFLYFFTEHKTYHLSFYLQTWRYAGCMSYELCNRPQW